MERGIFLYPWDLLDNGMDETIEQLKRMGITYVSVSILYHTAKLLLLNNSKHHMYINDGGTCFYNSNPDRYGRLMPIRNPLLATYSGDFFKDAIARFHEAGIKVGAWVVVFHNDYLARKYPDCALKNCFHESSPTNLCPSNPEVTDYALKLMEELADLGIDEVHLESVDYAGFLHGDHHEMQAFGDTCRLDQLMGMCYCPHCMERALKEGIDADRLLSLAKQEADDFFHFRKPSRDHEEFEKLFKSYLIMKQKQITTFYKDIQTLFKKNNPNIKVKPILWLAGDSDPLQCGVDVHKAGDFVDGVIAAYPDTDKSVNEFVKRVKTVVPEHTEITGGIRLMSPNTTDQEQVKRYVEAYRRCEVDNIIFYNYGMAPQPFLKQLEEI